MIVRDWVGEACFIFCGGPSLTTQPYRRLRGRRVIVINSSWERAPWADILYFHDNRWWKEYGKGVVNGFRGAVYNTMNIKHPRVTRLHNCRPGKVRFHKPSPDLKLSNKLDTVPMRRTSTAAAIAIAVHKGVRAIVLLGLDGKLAEDGKRNHYDVQYKFRGLPDPWKLHYEDLKGLVPQIAELGIDVINASPGSAFDLWPVMTLEQALSKIDGDEIDTTGGTSRVYQESGQAQTFTIA